jgi:hypothetical protein
VTVMEHVVKFVCINAVADSVMSYLHDDFYNTSFKIKHTLYTVSGSAPHLPRKNSGCSPACEVMLYAFERVEIFLDIVTCDIPL